MIGQAVGHYRILEELGRGGMGVVYSARDTRLDRTVALKFLPPQLAGSESDRARFLQEARTAATLSHPNVCSIHDIGEHEGTTFIVMDLVEGKTLKEMLPGLTQKQALDIGVQVADGLAAAHEKGIVHRDVKPENIMVRKDGIVQIMDFGLAKLAGVSRLTREGSTVGTVGYMSPEQVQGLNVDHRSDIFALGVLLYEMFVHRSPFAGVHETAVQYEIVNVDPPPMAAVDPGVDPALDAIVLECIAKDPADRYQSAAEVAKELRRFKRASGRSRASRVVQAYTPAGQPAPATSSPAPPAAPPPPTRRSMLPWLVAGACTTAAAALGLLLLRAPQQAPSGLPAITSSLVLPDSIHHHCYGFAAGPAQISPDGKILAFVGIPPAGRQQVYLRRMDSEDITPLEGTRGASYPFWSPDSRSLGFFADGKLKRIDLAGGPPTTITTAMNPRGGSWGADGTILFAPNYQTPLLRVPASGGTPVPATALDTVRGEASHRGAFFLPDGRHFLFLARVASDAGEAEGDAIMVGNLDGSPHRPVVASSSQPVYADGNILFIRGSALWAQRFDLNTLSAVGDPVRVYDRVQFDISVNLGVFTASRTGLLVLQPGNVEPGARLLLGDPAGTLRRFGDHVEQSQVRFSPDGNRLALYIYDLKTRRSNIWMYDIATATRQPVTSYRDGAFWPAFTPDGATLVFSKGGTEGPDLYARRLGRTEESVLFYASPDGDLLADFSPDGTLALIERTSPRQADRDLWMMDLRRDRKVQPFVKTGNNESEARFSPDGSLVSYTSDESGQPEVYVRPVADSENRVSRISAGGGRNARWGRDVSELYYVVPVTGEVLRATLRRTAAGVEVTARKSLFQLPLFADTWDVSRGGRSVVITSSNEQQKLPPLVLMSGWGSPRNP